MAESIKDKVAIVGMGCTRFGELWDQSPSSLVFDAAQEIGFFTDKVLEFKSGQTLHKDLGFIVIGLGHFQYEGTGSNAEKVFLGCRVFAGWVFRDQQSDDTVL